jgi:hypothetical protein
MRKGYYTGWNDNEKEEEKINIFYVLRPEDVPHPYHSRKEADDVRLWLNNRQMVIDTEHGGQYTCHDFQIEELSDRPGMFVVYCEAPFQILAQV